MAVLETGMTISDALVEDAVRRTLKDAGDKDGGRKRRLSGTNDENAFTRKRWTSDVLQAEQLQ